MELAIDSFLSLKCAVGIKVQSLVKYIRRPRQPTGPTESLRRKHPNFPKQLCYHSHGTDKGHSILPKMSTNSNNVNESLHKIFRKRHVNPGGSREICQQNVNKMTFC